VKIFLDTNVLIAASVRQHPHFDRADAVMQRCVRGKDRGVIHAHSLLEFHSAITQLPRGLAVPPAQVHVLLQEGLLDYLEMATLSPDEISALQKSAGEKGLIGGRIYDYYHLAVAMREKVERIYTFNTGDFLAWVEPDWAGKIVVP